jgi:hypothetical protein
LRRVGRSIRVDSSGINSDGRSATPHGRIVIMISHVEPGSAAMSDSLDLGAGEMTASRIEAMQRQMSCWKVLGIMLSKRELQFQGRGRGAKESAWVVSVV